MLFWLFRLDQEWQKYSCGQDSACQATLSGLLGYSGGLGGNGVHGLLQNLGPQEQEGSQGLMHPWLPCSHLIYHCKCGKQPLGPHACPVSSASGPTIYPGLWKSDMLLPLLSPLLLCALGWRCCHLP